MTFEEIKEDRKQKYIFDTNFGYEAKELDLALSMYSLGFDNGFSDLKKKIEQLEKQIESHRYSLETIVNETLYGNMGETEARSEALEELSKKWERGE